MTPLLATKYEEKKNVLHFMTLAPTETRVITTCLNHGTALEGGESGELDVWEQGDGGAKKNSFEGGRVGEH